MLEEQCYEMQQRYEKKQWLLAHLEEAAEVCHVECVCQAQFTLEWKSIGWTQR